MTSPDPIPPSPRDTQPNLARLLENLPDLIVRFDERGRHLYVSPSLARDFGAPAEFFLGKSLLDLGPVGDPLKMRHAHEVILKVFREGVAHTFETLWPGRAGERWLEVRNIPERDADGKVVAVLGIARDITARKRAEESQSLFRALIDHTYDSIEVIDPGTGRFIDVNETACRVHGYTREEYLSLKVADVVESFDLSEPAAWRGALENVRRNGPLTVQVRHRRKDGSTFPAEVNVGFVNLDRDYFVAVVRDVTERLRLEEQFRQAQKMEAVGLLVGGIAHDFNNLLLVIHMQTSLLLDRQGVEPAAKAGMENILTAAENAANLTRQLLTFGRHSQKQARDVDLGEVVRGLLRLLQRVLREDISLETRIAQNLPLVHADPGMMEQVVMNLAINARDAMPAGGLLIVTLHAAEVDAAQAARHPQAKTGPHLCLSVTDSGEGIAPEHLARIFDPFFTTKEEGKGTGLGLANVLRIVREHHGWIEVNTRQGQGSSFRVLLPSLPRGARASDRTTTAHAIRGGSETILLVEDEPTVRRLTRETLDKIGYRVIEAASAREALRLGDHRLDAVDLLITNLVMPGGITGAELARALHARRPSLRIIFTSGNNESLPERSPESDDAELLRKPYPAHELAARVRRVLDRVPPD